MTTACQAPLSSTISQSLLKLMSIESVMLSNHCILCCPLLLLPTVFPSIRVFPIEQYFTSGGQNIGTSASASVLPMTIQSWFLLELTGLISLQSKGLSRAFSSTKIRKHQFFCAQPSFWRKKWQPTPVFLSGESHEKKSLAGYRLWGCKESARTQQLGNNNSLLYGPTLTSIPDYWKNYSFYYTDLCWQNDVSAF